MSLFTWCEDLKSLGMFIALWLLLQLITKLSVLTLFEVWCFSNHFITLLGEEGVPQSLVPGPFLGRERIPQSLVPDSFCGWGEVLPKSGPAHGYRPPSALADPGGPRGLGPPTPRFGGPTYTVWRPHCQFKSKIMNFEALIFYFFKKFSSLASLSMNIIFFHILLVSLCSLFHLVFIMCILLYYIMCILLHYIDSSHNLSCL